MGSPGLVQFKRAVLYLKQNGLCYWCGYPMVWTKNHARYPTLEHRIPRSLGGNNAIDNLAVACTMCNQDRGNNIMYKPKEFKSLKKPAEKWDLQLAYKLAMKAKIRLATKRKLLSQILQQGERHSTTAS